ncbi:hypothetical protein TNIN_25781 [Trichonephila inaurata madagascariensis]|uniref:Uncharacterized protein n=1 Tax=Trichonephila inaurata madagascariensis TaxID=2747483 RepID=A0A8X6YDZ8_9ARAC|nr:hypothetical protein TNIN_25781 [Trichonephila inaurata madagascariensis]
MKTTVTSLHRNVFQGRDLKIRENCSPTETEKRGLLKIELKKFAWRQTKDFLAFWRIRGETLLVQIYVRELLSLVMKNAVSGRTKTDLPALHGEAWKLRSLEEALDEHKKYGDLQASLVGPALPEEILSGLGKKNGILKQTLKDRVL